MLPLERRVQWSERMEIPRQVLDTLADGAETLAAVLIGGKTLGVDKLVAKLPKVGPLAGMAALPALTAAAKMAGSQLREINAQARDAPRLPDCDAHAVQVGSGPRRRRTSCSSGASSEPVTTYPRASSGPLEGVPGGFGSSSTEGSPTHFSDYERSFADLEDEPTTWRRTAGKVALRFPDPLGRKDAAGRVIPHEFVVSGDLADEIESVEDGLHRSGPSLQRPMPESGMPRAHQTSASRR